jgi:hypothetical protein
VESTITGQRTPVPAPDFGQYLCVFERQNNLHWLPSVTNVLALLALVAAIATPRPVATPRAPAVPRGGGATPAAAVGAPAAAAEHHNPPPPASEIQHATPGSRVTPHSHAMCAPVASTRPLLWQEVIPPYPESPAVKRRAWFAYRFTQKEHAMDIACACPPPVSQRSHTVQCMVCCCVRVRHRKTINCAPTCC